MIFAVAVTMTNGDKPGIVNIQTVLKIWITSSVDEARGLAFDDATRINPTHQVLTILPVEITRHQAGETREQEIARLKATLVELGDPQ